MLSSQESRFGELHQRRTVCAPCQAYRTPASIVAAIEVERQLMTYQNVALSAHHEIQTKWQRQLTSREQWRYAQQKVNNAKSLFEESKRRYPLGLLDFQTLLSHQANLSQLERQSQVAKTNVFFADIDLMRSLGQPVF